MSSHDPIQTLAAHGSYARAGESQLTPATSLFLGLYLVTWTLLPLLSGREVPFDNVEILQWGTDPAWGYPKHPPFPAWIIYAFTQIFPASVPMTYGLGALQVAMMLGAAWLLGRELLGGRSASIAVLLITCITFYTNRMHYFNHNTALLVATAAATYCTWRAAQQRKTIWWIALGACWGIGMLCKYQMVVTIACNLAFLLSDRATNFLARLKGPVLAGSVAAALLLPHLLWVANNGFPTIQYAERYVGSDHSVIERISRMISFSADQLLRVVPLIVLLLILRPFANKAASAAATVQTVADETRVRIRRFLALHAWGPLVITNLLGLLIGLRLGMHWGTAFLWMLPLWFVATARGRSFVAVQPRTILTSLAGVHVAMALAFILSS